MNTLVEYFYQFSGAHMALVLGLLLVLIAAFGFGLLYHFLHKKAVQTESMLDHTFLEAIYFPVYLMLTLIAVSFFVPVFKNRLLSIDPNALEYIRLFFSISVITIILFVFNRYLSRIQDTITTIEKNRVVPNALAWVTACKLGRLISLIIFSIALLSMLELPIAQILAPAAILGVAISFGSQHILANMFGGLAVIVDKPFKVGDYVVISNFEEGTVRYIGWRVTQVRLRNGRILHVPNSVITTSAVTNYSDKAHWFVQKDIGIRYQDIATAKMIASEIEEWLNQHELINRRQVSFANLCDYADSSVVIRIRAYLKSTITVKHWYQFTEDMLLQASDIVNKYNADFAFPTTTVHVESNKTVGG